MTDPTVSNVRVTARAMTGPREGLPPCVTGSVIFDGRAAAISDTAICGDHPLLPKRFYVTAGLDGGVTANRAHPGYSDCYIDSQFIDLVTDDPDEAQAAFDKGAEYVRTGKLGEAT